jgi:DNA-binding SARP family transcriptional activator
MPRRAPAAVAAAEPLLKIRLLGELCIERDGERLALPPSRKTRALLAWLVLESREHTREQLCALFWDTPDDLRGALRWSLSRLRPLVDGREPRLFADRERVRFEATTASVDLSEVQALSTKGLAAASLAELQAAADAFRGELLEGLDLSEAFRFQAWCTAQREAARKLHSVVLTALCGRLDREPEAALPVARRMTALEPTDEAAHRRVMSLLLALGRPREALAQYEVCRSALRKNFGGIPSAETEALRRTIGTAATERVPSTPAPPSTAPPTLAPVPVPQHAPLIGRESERAALRHVLAADHPRLLLLVGEPGIGKSRLLDDLAASARADGVRVLAGRSFEAEQVRPYGCILDALGTAGLLGRDGVPSLLPDQHPAMTEAPPAEGRDRARLFEAVAALLRDAAKSGPLLIVLDDAQWMDEASSALTHYLVRTAPAGRLSIAAAARGGELADNPHVLRLLRTLRRDGLLRELELGPLDADGVVALLNGYDLRADAARVHRDSNGNPLIAIELARALAAGLPPLSGGLAEALELRLSALDPELATLLEWPAALGRGARPELLAQLTGRSVSEVLGRLGVLERYGILRAATDGGFDFTHDLLREAALRRVSAGRRRALHTALARSLWDSPEHPRDAVASTVARQALLGGEDGLAVRASAEAARQALRMFADQEALSWCERAFPLLPALPREERLRAWLTLLEVVLHSNRRSARLARVAEDLTKLVLEAEASGPPDVVADGYELLSHVHYFDEDEQAAIQGSLASVEAGRSHPDPLRRARSLAQAGRCLALIEREPERAGALLDEAAATAPPISPITDVPLGRGLLHITLGEEERARDELLQAMRMAHGAGDHWRKVESLFALCRLALNQRDAKAAQEYSREVVTVAEKMQEGHEPAQGQAFLALAECVAAQQQGRDTAEAERRCEAACAELRRNEARWRLSQILLIRAELAAEAGRFERAETLVAEATALVEAQTVQGRHGRAHLILAEIALLRGDAARAHEELRRTLAAPGALSARIRARVSRVASRLPHESVQTDG